MFSKVLLLFLLYKTAFVDNAKILGVFSVPSYSHYILGETLFKALAEKGHEVTMASSYPLKTPMKNYEDIYLADVLKFKNEGVIKMIVEAENKTIFSKLTLTQDILIKITDLCLNDTNMQKLLSSQQKYDLIVIDWVLNEALLGFSHHYNAPVIVISSFGSSYLTNKLTGNPAPFSYVPSNYYTNSDQLSFIQRIENSLSEMTIRLSNHILNEPEQQRILERYFPGAPPLQNLMENVSMVFLNSHFSIESPRPFLPNMIQIGGIHIQESNILSGELKEFLDEAKEGALLFSLGSNFNTSDLTTEQLDAIIKTLSKLPMKVLWKFDADESPEVAKNIKIGQWFPQPEILAHPNLKLFVTHGGLLSTTEAVYYGVPIVGIPCFSDQIMNIANAVRLGFGVQVTLEELTEDTLTAAINEVLKDPKYRNNMEKRSNWLRDQPVKPLDNAIFWTEYVIRHKGANHLKSSARKLSWYQYFLLDVFAFLIGVLGVIYLAIKFLILKVKALSFRKENRNKTVKSTKKKLKRR